VKNIGLVNIVAGREIVPELIQDEARAERIADSALPLLTDRGIQKSIKDQLKEVSERLGEKGASARAAEAVMEFIG
jgi:lipid-A-disaccharide synthase